MSEALTPSPSYSKYIFYILSLNFSEITSTAAGLATDPSPTVADPSKGAYFLNKTVISHFLDVINQFLYILEWTL